MTLYVEDYEYVLEELQKRFGFSVDHAADAIERMAQKPAVFNGFVHFLKTENHQNLTFNGHDINDLMLNYGLSPVGAYLMLALIAVDPTRAEGYLEQIKEEGHEEAEYNPDGSIKKITFRSVGKEGSEPPICPTCGKPATWIEQYKRWYCYDCKEYL